MVPPNVLLPEKTLRKRAAFSRGTNNSAPSFAAKISFVRDNFRIFRDKRGFQTLDMSKPDHALIIAIFGAAVKRFSPALSFERQKRGDERSKAGGERLRTGDQRTKAGNERPKGGTDVRRGRGPFSEGHIKIGRNVKNGIKIGMRTRERHKKRFFGTVRAGI